MRVMKMMMMMELKSRKHVWVKAARETNAGPNEDED